MKGIGCGMALGKRASWRRLPSGASNSRWKAWTRPQAGSCSTASNASAAPEAPPRQRALRVAGRGRGAGHPEPDAGRDGQGFEPAGAGPLHRRVADGPRSEPAGDCREAVSEQGLGEHAEAAAGGDEPGDPGVALPRSVPRLRLHVHAAAVQAHERGFAGGDRTVHEGRGRPAAERAGDRIVGASLLPRPGRAAGGDRGRQAELVAGADEVGSGGPGRLQ